MAEEIELKLAVPDAFFSELDRRFDALARRATQSFNAAARAQGGGVAGLLGGASGATPGGGGGNQGGAVSNALGGGVGGGIGAFAAQAGLATLQGVGQGIRSTPAAAASSPSVLAQNAAVSGTGALLENTVGKVPILGDLIMAQFNSVKEAMEVPTERGVNRLKSIYGNFAAAGVTTSAAEREQAIEFSIQVERKRYEGERNLERQYREIAARDSASYGLSWIGR